MYLLYTSANFAYKKLCILYTDFGIAERGRGAAGHNGDFEIQQALPRIVQLR